VVVNDKCLIRAEFHSPQKKFPYEIIITPRMSFGTGHHQTTWHMISAQMTIDHTGRRVMDAGCGTAILSIMACKLGAGSVEAFDTDEWSVINGGENVAINNCNNISISKGSLNELTFNVPFDIILANINKNILLNDMAGYRQYLTDSGLLLMSGFHTDDIPDILGHAAKFGLREHMRYQRENWAALLVGF
jgi:ribosomal protein L11 methyltransferase